MSEYPPPPPLAPEAPVIPGGASGPRANFGQRLVALLIDWAMLIVVNLILEGARHGGVAPRTGDLDRLLHVLRGRPDRSDARQAGDGDPRLRLQPAGGPIGYGRGFIRYLGRSSRRSRAASATSGCSGTRRSSAGRTRSRRRSSSRSRPIRCRSSSGGVLGPTSTTRCRTAPRSGRARGAARRACPARRSCRARARR